MLMEAIEDLLDNKSFSKERMEKITEAIFQNPIPEQVSAFLILLRAKSLSPEQLSGILDALKKEMIQVNVPFPVLDIAGTGGDGAHTINISTGAAVIAASCGVKVAKHGNRSVTSKCGTADVLEEMGIIFQKDAEKVAKTLSNIGIDFLYAPYFHLIFQKIATIRKNLKIKTVFNVVGPLLNPANAAYLMVGVYEAKLMNLFARTLLENGIKRALVIHGRGLDEVSCLGPSEILHVNEGKIFSLNIDPKAYGLSYCNLEDLRGGKPSENALRLLSIFSGEKDPASETLILNAGLALWLYGMVPTIQEGVSLAGSALNKGLPMKLLNKWREYVFARD